MKNRKQIWYIVSSIFFAAYLFTPPRQITKIIQMLDKQLLKPIPTPCLVYQLILNTIVKSILLVGLRPKYQ